jgi:hypothetical protein
MDPGKNIGRHMKSIFITSVLLTVTILLGACSKSIPYTGDGRLVDHGWTAAHDRYVVELGPLDLTRTGSTTFRIAGLPATHFVVGLQVPVAAEKAQSADSGTPADVALQLIHLPAEQVLIITGPLRGLTWSGPLNGSTSFVYRRESYGSYFDSDPRATYQLRVVVNTPDPSIPAGSLVVLKSGGWQ